MLEQEENKAHHNDDSISQSMLQEIEERTSHLQSDFAAELDKNKKKKQMIPKINLEKLEDKNGRQIEGPIHLVNQSVSHHPTDAQQENSKNQLTLEMDENPDTSRAQVSEYNHTERKSGAPKRPRRKNEKRMAAKQKQSAEDSVVLNEILSNYGNQSKIKEILEKNK